MLSRDFEIFYYSDTKRVNVEPHTHDYYEFYFYMEGNVKFEINEELKTISQGDFIIVPPGLKHRAVVMDQSTPYRRFVFWISARYAMELARRFPDFKYLLDYIEQPDARHIFHNDVIAFNSIMSKNVQLLEEIQGSRFARTAMVEVMVEELLLLLNRIVHDQVAPRAGVQEEDQKLYIRVMEYVDQNLEEDLTLDRLSDLFFVSKYHIAHTFKEKLGISVHQYVIKKRLQACRDAILTNEKISEVYLAYGFKDYPSFFRAFRKEYGVTPKEFRELSTVPGRIEETDRNSGAEKE